MKTKKDNRGGKRVDAGRKKRFNENTVTIAFRVPESKREEIKELVADKLIEWEIK